MVFEHQDEYPSQWNAICTIGEKLGVHHESLRIWVRRAETDAGQRPGLTTDERERLKQLERENRELKRANEILKSVSREPAPTAPASPGFCTATKWQWSRSPAATVKNDAATASPTPSTRSPPLVLPSPAKQPQCRSRELATWKPYGR